MSDWYDRRIRRELAWREEDLYNEAVIEAERIRQEEQAQLNREMRPALIKRIEDAILLGFDDQEVIAAGEAFVANWKPQG